MTDAAAPVGSPRDAARPAGPGTAGPDTAGPDTASPDTAGPDTAGRDSAAPSTPRVMDEETIAFANKVLDLARDGDAEQLAELVDAGVPVDLTGSKGDTLLLLAAYHDSPATVRALLERGADTGRVNDRGQTALGAAVFRQSAESVGALLAAGADPDAGGPSARELAAFFDLPEMLRLLAAGPPR